MSENLSSFVTFSTGLFPYITGPFKKIALELWIDLFPQTLGSTFVIAWAHGPGTKSERRFDIIRKKAT